MPKVMPLGYEDYSFDSPLLLIGERPHVFSDVSSWSTPDDWRLALQKDALAARAIIIPLELSAPKWKRQDLLGYELLSTLRWTTDASLRGLPVLMAAWQPLEYILKKRPDLLIVHPATDFSRLPQDGGCAKRFFEAVSLGQIRAATISEIEECAEGASDAARRLSYHDLANDYYAAYRIWRGYKALVQESAKKGVDKAVTEAKVILDENFPWEKYIVEKMQSPLIRRFQASRINVSAPRYPTVDERAEILRYHVESGLPEGTRLLLVDDEFQKGTAEVLLRVLFHKKEFTKRLSDEWVYSEQSVKKPRDCWARFVCVKNATLARNWLRYWGELPSSTSDDQAWHDWLQNWNRELNPQSKVDIRLLDPVDVFSENLGVVLDRPSAGPRIKSTVMLLDLRLEPVDKGLYSVREFPSFKLREDVKDKKPDLPIIMFTASRQILNMAELLDSSSYIDGWFVKEGPDIPLDSHDANSANAVSYLLERVHLHSTLAGWYRDSLKWDTNRKLAYARLFHSAEKSSVFEEIAQIATALFEEVRNGSTGCSRTDTRTFLAFIQERVSPQPFKIAQTLVARRVAVATLLLTADPTPSGLDWNTDQFDNVLPGRPSDKIVKAVYNKISFNQVLWMRSSEVLAQLLREEFDWLDGLEWPKQKKGAIKKALHREQTLTGF